MKDNLKDINTTSSLADIPQNQQQLEFVQAAPDSPVTYHNASYDDDIRELTEYWYLPKRLVVTVVTTSTDFIISKGAWPPSSARLQPQQATSRGGPQDMHSASC